MTSENRYERFIGVLVCGGVGDVLGFVNKGKKHDDIKRDESNFTWTYFHYLHGSNIELMTAFGRYLLSLYFHKHQQDNDLEQPVKDNDINKNIDIPNDANEKDIKIINHVHFLYKNVVENSKKIYTNRTRDILLSWQPLINIPPGTINNCDAAIRLTPLALTPLKPDTQLYNEIINFVYYTHGGNKDSTDVAFVHIKLLHSLLFEKRKSAEELYPYALYLAQFCKNKNLHVNLVAINPNNKQNFVSNNWNITRSLYGFDFFHTEAIDCFVCALACFLYNFNNPVKAMNIAMKTGGDTETITKLTGDMVGAFHGFRWLPTEWSKIENRELLTNIATSLYSCFPREKHGWVSSIL